MKEKSMSDPKPAGTEVTDAKGRKLVIREPDFLQEARINRLVGESSTNVGFMCGYCLPAIHIAAIDGEAVPFPATYLQLEGVISRAGREGRDAVAKYLEDKQKDAAAHVDSVKN